MDVSPSMELVHGSVPGRFRFAISALRRNPELAQELGAVLRSVPGVERVSVSPATATALVLGDPSLTRAPLEAALRGLLPDAVWGPAPRAPAAKPAPPPTRAPAPRAAPAPAAAERDAPGAPAFHVASLDDLRRALGTAEGGLSPELAAERLRAEGANTLAPPARRSELRILVDQLASTPVAMLGASAVLSSATGGLADAAAILAVLAINAGIGYATESGAERTIATLTKSPDGTVRVLRGGREESVAVAELVRGDVITLVPGAIVPADARLLEAHDLTLDESCLTGESMPVGKSASAACDEAVPLAERVNMVHRGTLVTGGSGRALVVAVGVNTEVGRIQTLASGVEQRATPMQEQLDRLGRQLAIGAGAACAATVGVGLLRGQAALPLLRTAISLGVAAVPEGLPTVAITTLALGLSRMRDERVLVRKLAAVETLGSVQVVCLDKTGTLTENRMSVVAIATGDASYVVRGARIEDEAGQAVSAAAPALASLLHVGVLCSEVELDEEHGVCVLRGSPTESALVQLAVDQGLDVRFVRQQRPLRSMQRRAEHRNYMSTLHDGEAGSYLAVKGRPSEVLALCGRRLGATGEQPLTPEDRAAIENTNERLAGRALRMLGIAYLDRDVAHAHDHDLLPELVWVGLVGMEDPPRPRVREVMASFHRAGIRTVMITGDQSGTAHAVGKAVGLSGDGAVEIVDSTRLDKLAPDVLAALAQRTHVFSRVSPAHKLQIVQALQRAGLVVAMTGDGVNDGPALKAADIGIAMGAGGTSVARDVADVVLTDDRLDTLVLAIEQGRTIYDDIRKAVHFILATNLSEILYTFSCVAAGLGEPLSPMQLLWINLLTDVFPELALAVEPPESDVLGRAPRDPKRAMFERGDLGRIAIEGGVITAGALSAYLWAARRGGPGPRASTMGFMTLTLAQLLHAVSARSEHRSIFDGEPLRKNPWLLAALGGTLGLQLLASAVPGLRTLLGTVPLAPRDWGVTLLAAGAPFVVNELTKTAARSALPAAHPVVVGAAV